MTKSQITYLKLNKHVVLYVTYAGGHLYYEKCVSMNGLFIMQMSNEYAWGQSVFKDLFEVAVRLVVYNLRKL